MLNTGLLIFAIACYSCATWMVYAFIQQAGTNTTKDASILTQVSVVAIVATITHTVYAFNISQLNGALNFSLSSMSVLISAILMIVYLIGCGWMPIRRLGVLIYPFTIITLLFAAIWNSDANFLTERDTAFNAHILIAILAYCLLTIATIQALLYFYQDKQIKHRSKPSLLLALPPLQTMESLLFRLVGLGFILLTLTLFSGAIFSQQIFGHAFVFKHHTILAILGWCVFAYLLFQRLHHGLRGSVAVIFTVIGFVLIQLGYFGTKLVTESLTTQF